MNKLGAKIKKLRTEKGWSLDELASKSGIAKTTIWGIEKGSQPSYDKINKLARAFGISSLDFLADDEHTPEQESFDYVASEEFRLITATHIAESVMNEMEFIIPFIEYINKKKLKSKYNVRELIGCKFEDLVVDNNYLTNKNYNDLMSLLVSIIDNRLLRYESSMKANKEEDD